MCSSPVVAQASECGGGRSSLVQALDTVRSWSRGLRWCKVCSAGMSYLPGAEGTGTFLASCGFLTGWCITREQGPRVRRRAAGKEWHGPPTHPLPVSVSGHQQSTGAPSPSWDLVSLCCSDLEKMEPPCLGRGYGALRSSGHMCPQ